MARSFNDILEPWKQVRGDESPHCVTVAAFDRVQHAVIGAEIMADPLNYPVAVYDNGRFALQNVT